MKTSHIRNVVLALAALAVPYQASAQPQIEGAEQIDQVRRDSRIHLGPLYVSPTILLKELGVDSNVFNAAGEQKSDFTFTVAPKVDVWLPVARRALFQGTAATDLVYYAKYDSERSVDPQFSGPRRNLSPPPHAVRRRRLPQHAAAPELRDRPARAARREQRRPPASPCS